MIPLNQNFHFVRLTAVGSSVGGFRRYFPALTALADRRCRWWRWFAGPLAAVYLLICVAQIIGSFLEPFGWLVPMRSLYSAVAPLRSVNTYGLFAVMTTSRHEIVLEGSEDGIEWREYEFKYKPGDLRRRPEFVAPLQPRLDWQMWFAALGRYQHNPWFINFCVRLLQGQPEVLALLKSNPFPTPPRYIRGVVYDYHFTDAATRRATGQWWRREFLGAYCPVLSLKSETGL